MHNRWYWLFKNVLLGPFLRIYNRPEVTGLENIPDQGSAIIASNHQSVMDSFYFPLVCKRQLTFPAKSEYFTTPGFVGSLQKWFFSSVGQVPIDRSSGTALDSMRQAAQEVFSRGDLFAIYPEGTRSPDGRVYKGRTGMARIALETGQKIVPMAMIGSRNANPIGSWVLRPAKVRMKVGTPIDPIGVVKEAGLNPEDSQAPRYLTDYVMKRIVELSGQSYVDLYASDVKKALAEGKGYPPEAQPL